MKNIRIIKRMLAVFLAIMVSVSLMPGMVFAGGELPGTGNGSEAIEESDTEPGEGGGEASSGDIVAEDPGVPGQDENELNALGAGDVAAAAAPILVSTGAEFASAVASAKDGDTIQLKNSITYNYSSDYQQQPNPHLQIGYESGRGNPYGKPNIKITIDVAGYNLDITNSNYWGLFVCSGSRLTFDDSKGLDGTVNRVTIRSQGYSTSLLVAGKLELTDRFITAGSELNVAGRYGLSLNGPADGSASATVTNINTQLSGIGTNINGGTATVLGNIECTTETSSESIWAYGGLKVFVKGSVTSKGSYAILAEKEGTVVNVEGNVEQTATSSAKGICAKDKAVVNVGGAVVSAGGDAIIAHGEGKVIVEATGKTLAVASAGGTGITASGQGTQVKVTGNVAGSAASSSRGVTASEGARVHVSGSATGRSVGAEAMDAGTRVEVGEDSIATYTGTSEGASGVSTARGAEVVVGRNVESGRTGVNCNSGSKVTVDGVIKWFGSITLDSYIRVGSFSKTQADDEDFTTKQGYYTFAGGTSTVWVKYPSAPSLYIGITTQPASPAPIKSNDIKGALGVVAVLQPGHGTLAYRWYESADGSNNSGTAIDGATGPGYAIPTNLAPGQYFYFCEISDPAPFSYATTLRSDVATVTIIGPAPAAKIDYAGEQLTGLEKEARYGISGTNDEGEEGSICFDTDANGTFRIPADWLGNTFKLTMRSPFNDDVKISDPYNLVIPARRAAPATASGGPLEITGVNGTMEYRRTGGGGGAAWTDVPAGASKITGLTVGAYNVRYKATDKAFTGSNRRVEVVPLGQGYVCQVAGKSKKYYSLSEAMLDVKAGGTIKMLSDISLTTGISFYTNLILDMSGKKLATTGDLYVNNASVTFKGGSIEAQRIGVGNGTVNLPALVLNYENTGGSAALYCSNYSQMTVNGNITLTDNSYINIWNSSSLKVNGDITANATLGGRSILINESGCNVTINGNISTNGKGIVCGNSTAAVTGNIDAGSTAVEASSAEGRAAVYGNASSAADDCLKAGTGGAVTVTGNVTAGAGFPAHARDANSTVTVGGKVDRADGSPEIADVDSGGKAVFNGDIPRPSKAKIGGTSYDLDGINKDTSQTVEGFTTYTYSGAAVWLKERPAPLKILSVAPAHAVLTEKGETETFTAALSTGQLTSGSNLVWKISNPSKASITPSPDKKTAVVNITDDSAHAILLVTATYTDEHNVVYTATATVELLAHGFDTGTTVKLLDSKATINTAKIQGALIPVVITGRPKADVGIMSAVSAFGAIDYNAVVLSGTHKDKFTAAMINDRHLEIKAKDGTKNGTYKGVSVTINGIFAGTIDLTVAESYPKITLKAETLNLAFPGQKATITAASADGECMVLKVDTVSPVHNGMIVFENGDLRLDTAKIKKAATISTTVNVRVEGYKKHYKTAPKLSVKVINTQPKLKLLENTVTLQTWNKAFDAYLRFVPAVKNATLESFGVIESVTIDDDPSNLNDGDGWVCIPGFTAPGSHTMKVWYKDAAEPVSLKFTVKTIAFDQITVSAKTKGVALSNVTGNDIAHVDLSFNADNMYINDWAVSSGAATLPTGVSFKNWSYDKRVSFMLSGSPAVTGPIPIEINSAGSPLKNPIKLNLSVTNKPASMKLTQTGKIDVTDPSSILAARVKLTGTYAYTGNAVITEHQDLFEILNLDGRNGYFEIRARSTAKPVPGVKYPVKVKLTLENGQWAEQVINITPVQPKTKALANKSEITLYKATRHTGETVNLHLTAPAHIKLSHVRINEDSVKNNDHFDVVRTGENSFTIKLQEDFDPSLQVNGKTAYKSSYSIKLELWAEGTHEINSGKFDGPLKHTLPGGKVVQSKPTLVTVKVNIK